MNVIVKLKNRILSDFICEYLESNGITVSTDIVNIPSETKLDVAIVDNLNLSSEFITKIRDAKIILFDTGLNTEEIVRCFNSFNIHGIISPDADKRRLIEAINSVHEGAIWINNHNLKDLLHKKSPKMAWEGLIQHLTERENQVMECLLQGLTNKEIANMLSISEQTVKSHMRSIFKKFNVSNRCQLITLILRGKKQSAR